MTPEQIFDKYRPKLPANGKGLSLGDAAISMNGAFSEGGHLLLAFATPNERSQTFLLTPLVIERLTKLLAHE